MGLFNGEIQSDEIDNWLKQFDASEIYYINRLLENFIYFDTNRVRKAVKSLHNKVIRNSNLDVSNIWFVPVGYVTKSGSVIAYYYRSVNKLGEGNFISSNDLNRISNKKNISIVFIDDYIGTGHQAKQVWEYVLKPYFLQFSNCKFFYCTLAGTDEGINFVIDNTKFEVMVDKIIHNNELPFHEESMIFEDTIERKKAEDIVKKYGDYLYPGNPLGYRNSQALIGFFYSTPNNTLPIFWSTNEKWHPLLPRNESYRDPKNLVGSIAGLDDKINYVEKRTLNEISKLEDYDVSNEFITKGINEFQKLPNILRLIQPMKQLGFSEEIFIKVVSLIAKIKRNVHEKEAVRSSILLVSDCEELNDIGNFYVKVAGLNIDDTDKILTLVGMLFSYNNTIVIDYKGNVLGILNLLNEGSVNIFLPTEFKRILYATQKKDGMAILCNGEDRVSIIYNGERILLFRGASWSLASSNLNDTVMKLSIENHIKFEILRKIFEIVFRMSYIGKGALITIGDEDKVKSYSEEPAAEFVKQLNLDICTLSVDAAIGIMEQDGATIISEEGAIIQTMTFLRPPTNAPGNVEINRGSKHSTAVKISVVTDALVIAVSVDGRITFYKSGDIIIKMMG